MMVTGVPAMNLLNILKIWLRPKGPTGISIPSPMGTAAIPAPGVSVPEDTVVADERTRIDDLRAVAKWQLAALGAVATVAFTGVAVSKLPNAADTESGGFVALIVAGLGAALTLISIVLMIRLVGLVLAPQYQSLEDQIEESSRRKQKVKMWYDQPTLYLPFPQITTLEAFLATRLAAYTKYNSLAGQDNRTPDDDKELEALSKAFTTYFNPVALRLNWRNRRELVAKRARLALLGLAWLGSIAGIGVVAYLGASAYKSTTPAPLQSLLLPAYGTWTPLNEEKPAWTLATLTTDLGKDCPLVIAGTQSSGVRVLVLREIPADKTFEIVVIHPPCNPRLYTTSMSTVSPGNAIEPTSASVIPPQKVLGSANH